MRLSCYGLQALANTPSVGEPSTLVFIIIYYNSDPLFNIYAAVFSGWPPSLFIDYQPFTVRFGRVPPPYGRHCLA